MIKVLPRDAFNDANLLKCVARLTLLIEDGLIPLRYEYDGAPFDIQQCAASGQTFVANLQFFAPDGTHLPHARNMNDRGAWPLWFELAHDSFAPFDEKGAYVLGDRFWLEESDT